MGKLTTELILKDSFSDKLNKINKSVQKTVALMSRMGVIGTKGVQSQINAQQKLILSEHQVIRAKERTIQAGRKIALQTQKNVGLATQHAIATQRQEAAAYRAMAAEQKTTQAKLKVTHLAQQSYIARQKENVEIARGLTAEQKKLTAAERTKQAVERTTQAKIRNSTVGRQITLEQMRHAHWIERQNARLREQEGIYNRIRNIASRIRNVLTLLYTAQMAFQGIGSAVGLSDKMTMAEARLGLMADSKTSVGDIEAKSFGAAQRATTDYLQFTKAVSKMGILAGDKFADQDSVIRFTELMNKQFQVGGAETSERNAAMLQLTQAIASNRLGGDELRTIRETAPLLVKYIQKSLNVGEAEFKKLAKEGEITADVIIKAMAESSAELEKMYANLPLTWERTWIRMKNIGVIAFKPIQEQLTRLFNNKTFLAFVNKITDSLIVLGKIGGWAFETLFDGLGWLVEKSKALSGAFTSLAISLGIVAGAFLIHRGWLMAIAAWQAIVTFSTWAYTWAVTMATTGINLATVATRGWAIATAILQIIMGNWALLVVALLAGIIYWVYKTSDGWADAMGKIVGSCYAAFEVVRSIVVGVVQGIGVVLNNAWASIRQGFWSLLNGLVELYVGFLRKINIKGVFDDAIKTATTTAQQLDAKAFNAKWDKKTLDTSALFNISGAYDKGYGKGSGLVNKFSSGISKLTTPTLDMEKTKMEALKGIAGNTADTADAANKGAKAGEQTAKNTAHQEDYSYLRDWSYQRGLGSSIGYNIKIEQNNRNNIASGLDVSSIVNAVLDGIVEGLNNNAERGFAR